jgi:hypothetical protein
MAFKRVIIRRVGPLFWLLGAMSLNSVLIFVPLADEGTDVWRPVQAELIAPHKYKLLGHIPTDEIWLFVPGQIVVCEHKTFVDGSCGLVSIRSAA